MVLGPTIKNIDITVGVLLNGASLADATDAIIAALLSDRVLGAITPIYAQSLLTDWERVLDITLIADSNYQQRLENVLFKLAETGGLSIPYFTRLADRLGYTITIDELRPFRSGISRCGESLMHHDVMWAWRVNITGTQVRKYVFRTGLSAVGERLLSFGDTVIESVFNDLKPAHTFCYFSYQDR
ncbi:MAG: YmfQ family protein [Symbiopectobacterium sp.]|uniref:YmfQ family protein n=1 Tax=Symbiopectobacterium sp. TaxID=2952789 RepID=UPI0039E837D3